MRNVKPIAIREIKGYFNSPIAYIVVAVFLVIAGYLYFSTAFLIGQSSLRSFFAITPILLVVFAPAVTMRLVAEEVRSVFSNLVFETVVPRNVRLAEAPSHGRPIHAYDLRSRGSQAYLQLGREFMQRVEAASGA